ncbi:MAG: ABC transporter ATP-binding protein [Desulfobacterales bacterium]|jgi:oligopeptide/dipeptide ABC transporter ATP-binding protein
MTADILTVTNLNLDYLTTRGRLKALRDVNLSIPAGQVVGVVGESGCGKSTLISAIMNLMPENAEVRSGQILFNGHDNLKLSQDALRKIRGKEITMIFQDPMTALNPVISIGSQMTDIQYRDRLSKREKTERALEMLARVGIPDPENRLKSYPHHFSGGMLQRITIAMALMANPKLLIADEPTTALDATLEVQVVQLLKDLQKSYQCSMLFISHHLNVIAELSQTVIVMYAGEIVEQGTVRDIFHRAAHPYTKALLQCDPSIIKEKSRQLPTIPGELPDLVYLPDCCIFASRCPEVMPKCRSNPPTEYRVGDMHRARCFLVEKEERP